MPCRWVRGMRREAAKAGVSLDAAARGRPWPPVAAAGTGR